MAIDINDIRPVIITAPTARNGITLLQRLLNSSGNIVIYGENSHLVEALPQMVFNCLGIHVNHQESAEEALRRFQTETTDFWSSSLWPDTKGYVELMADCFRLFIQYYQRYSEQIGFKRWGIKHPCRDLKAFDRFLTLLPNGRFIYIYRNLYDVARSAKARRFTITPEDFEKLAHCWLESVSLIINQKLPNLLVLRYEALIENPSPILQSIEAFTQVEHINPQILERKVNTFVGSPHEGRSANEYIAPAELTATERKILTQVAGDLLKRLNYCDTPAELSRS